MENCCKNSYRVCTPFVGCPTELLIQVPSSYSEESIIMRLVKGNVSIDFNLPIEDGYAYLDVDANIPEGFINGFGSPLYELILLDINSGQIVELQSTGDPVTSIIFQVITGTTSIPTFTITY